MREGRPACRSDVRKVFVPYEWKKSEKALTFPEPFPHRSPFPSRSFSGYARKGTPTARRSARRRRPVFPVVRGQHAAEEGGGPGRLACVCGVPWNTAEAVPPGAVLNKDALRYTLMIRQPDFVTDGLAARGIAATNGKKPHPLYESVSFGRWNDGLCVQMLHVGPYDVEPERFSLMQTYCAEHGLRRVSGWHREIDLSDARRTDPARLKTVLRFRVEACA